MLYLLHRWLLSLLLVVSVPFCCWSQETVKGLVTDARSGQGLPFATIKLGESGQGTVSDLNGAFEIKIGKSISFLQFSYLGYDSKTVKLPVSYPYLQIKLNAREGVLSEVVIKPPFEKIKRILNSAIANKDKNNPDLCDRYSCHVYYKMKADMLLPDSALLKDTSKNARLLKTLTKDEHLMVSETYSIRNWQRPQQLQEEIVATRFSGLKKSVFTSLVTDVLPFHSYNDYISLNGKDYYNPVAKGYNQRYDFDLVDEIMQGSDTVWILSFKPKKGTNDLKGSVYINSRQYAISNFIANAHDGQLKRTVGIEQQYQYLPVPGSKEGRWFPKQLNYYIDMQQKAGSKKTKDTLSYSILLSGTSSIDSVSWDANQHFHFDKIHTVKLRPNADEMSDTSWRALRPVKLDEKEVKTYHFDDSLMEKVHGERILSYFSKLPEGKVPLSIFDIDLKRLFRFNLYESVRLGLGAQTNEKLIKWLSVGGWAGYGFGDHARKYGAFAEAYLDPYKEFVIRAGYDNDIVDPGRVLLNPELDKNLVSNFLLGHVDSVASYYVSVRKRLGYWSAELEGRQEYISAKYNYALQYDPFQYASRFKAQEVSLRLRYAFAERSAPVFGYYQSLGSKYPIWYGKLTQGTIQGSDGSTYSSNYTQAVSAIVYHKHINRLGFEHFMLEGAKSWSDKTLPLGKLFAGNGFGYDHYAFYAFGGMMTFNPYDYYSDQFVNFIFRHDFDWKLYKVTFGPHGIYSSAPNISLGYNMLYGSLQQRERQEANIAVPDPAYHEAGILLQNIFRSKSSGYYSTVHIGYYYHIDPTFDLGKNGRFVIGAGFEL